MFNLKYNDELHILVYQNIYAKGTNKVKNIMWSDWCEWLTRPVVSHNKYANGLAIYGDVSDGVDDETGEILQHHRRDENVMYRQVFSLDYDDIDDMDRFIENIKSKMHHFAYFMYSTFRHRDEHDEDDKDLRPRFRLLIPIDDIVKPDEYTKYAKALSKYIGETIDESCFTPIQLSALPTIKDKEKPYHWYINDAPFITREQLDSCVEKYPYEDEKIIVDHSKKYKKRSENYWRERAFGVGKGERNQALASIIGHLLKRYVDAHLVYGLVSAWAKTCNPPLSDKEVNQTFNSILRIHLNK
ncbi:primase alpha helix C-terminal domain-containing protein [Staphylococcus haemolyticus]|uniref:primase alpha helix C-terminal domain-containing protein n=1 Tax=Staphylococcus haemolyticus TaxID=1283 RepID=UPI001F56ED4E|nr:primase alpha helix C-terminal domain-containing protein [Staphylococcus haemolyticus]MCI2929771.1 primase alpha helix C-terminal domain-containing protein [Staphylococcus haemolyticus]MCI2936932.1 primase alpha helix C-terminal domain-containing protein [Staphylococcus haemolyticus]MCI2939150.1 primase alpha helix C-terminal domain-containing protein [Staphylococcus haemolyticus]